MYLKFIVVIIGGFILSTNLGAAELKNQPVSPIQNKSSQDKMTKEHLKEMENVHHHNVIFDDYHTGGTPYQRYEAIPHETTKGK